MSKLNMTTTNVEEIRAQIAEDEARREAKRFSPTFMHSLRQAIDRWNRDLAGKDWTRAEWVMFVARALGDAANEIDGIAFEETMVEIAAIAAVANRAHYPAEGLQHWEEQEAIRAGKLERNRK